MNKEQAERLVRSRYNTKHLGNVPPNVLLHDINQINDIDLMEAIALILNEQYLYNLINFERSKRVRYIVAQRIEINYLLKMIDDNFWAVRFEVAKRIPDRYLSKMINDDYYGVRKIVAERVSIRYFNKFKDEQNQSVLMALAKRSNNLQLTQLLGWSKSKHKELRAFCFDKLQPSEVPEKFKIAYDNYHVLRVMNG